MAFPPVNQGPTTPNAPTMGPGPAIAPPGGPLGAPPMGPPPMPPMPPMAPPMAPPMGPQGPQGGLSKFQDLAMLIQQLKSMGLGDPESIEACFKLPSGNYVEVEISSKSDDDESY